MTIILPPSPSAQSARAAIRRACRSRGLLARRDRGFLVVTGSRLARPVALWTYWDSGAGYQISNFIAPRRRRATHPEEEIRIAMVSLTGTVRITTSDLLEPHIKVVGGQAIVKSDVALQFPTLAQALI